MVRHTIHCQDGRTKLVLEIDPARVKVHDEHTLSVKPPKSWVLDPRPARVTDLDLVQDWFHHLDDCLDAVGIRIVAVEEDGVALARGSSKD